MCKCSKKKKKSCVKKIELLERIRCLEEIVDGLVTSVSNIKRRTSDTMQSKDQIDLVCNSL